MAFYKKRDRIEMIADILCTCKSPQTRNSIRGGTSVSYVILQNCLEQLLKSECISIVENSDGQKKFAVTEKGFLFLRKFAELQNFTGAKSKQMPLLVVPQIRKTPSQKKY